MIWRYRELLRSLVSRDVKIKYQRSLLGLVWTTLNPLVMVVVLITVFSYIIRIQITNYWAFLISGFFVWSFIQQSLYHATTLLRDHATLSHSVAFPSEILIISTLMAKLLEYLIEISIVLLILFVAHHHAIPSSVFLLPYLILLQILITAGIMFPLSVWSVMFYDVQHALPLVIIVFFYLSPVIYPVSMVPEDIRPYYYLNPFAGLLRLFHLILYEGYWPSWRLLVSVSGYAAILFLTGYMIFRRYKRVCIEIA